MTVNEREAIALTVAIPTYNGALRVPQVLERLRSQLNPEGIAWEIIVVDNNSSDETAAVVRQYQQNWPEAIPLHYVFEPRQGLAFARQCGIEHARGALVGFLDDDNWPRPNWVTEVVKFGQSHPRVGAYGGRIYGVFESPPEDAVKPLLRFLAVRDRGPEPKPFQPADLQFPPGAGLVVRRAAWLACVPPTLVRTARAGDDYEISVRLAKHGWLIWYNPTMEIDHFIPAARLRREYLKPLIHLYGLCTCELLMIETPWWRRPFLLFKSFIGSLHRIGWHYIKYGWHSQHTLQADCELSFHVGNLKSPWIYLLNKFL